jgi:hypothetical protein
VTQVFLNLLIRLKSKAIKLDPQFTNSFRDSLSLAIDLICNEMALSEYWTINFPPAPAMINPHIEDKEYDLKSSAYYFWELDHLISAPKTMTMVRRKILTPSDIPSLACSAHINESCLWSTSMLCALARQCLRW